MNQQIKDLCDLAKQYGLKRIKSGDIELEFDARVGAPDQPSLPQSIKDTPTTEELLMWSSPFATDKESDDGN